MKRNERFVMLTQQNKSFPMNRPMRQSLIAEAAVAGYRNSLKSRRGPVPIVIDNTPRSSLQRSRSAIPNLGYFSLL